MKISKIDFERYSKQIILKKFGVIGQKKTMSTKVLIFGVGGLGCPLSIYLANLGIGNIGIVDDDKVELSNLNRQIIFSQKDIGKYKVDVVKKNIKLINPKIKVKIYKKKIDEKNLKKIIKNYEIIIDATDNFKTKFLLNKYSLKHKKFLIVGAISKFDGHIFTFNFKDNKSPCLKCFYQTTPSDEILNCESEGILGPVAGIIGNLQSNEALKKILNINSNLNNQILIVNLINLNFRKVKFTKKKNCIC